MVAKPRTSAQLLLAFLILVGLLSNSWAQTQSTSAQTVEVRSLAHPELRSYGKLVEGSRVFERYHSLAPSATLHYMVHPRLAGVDMHNLHVKISGETVNIPLELDSEYRFTIPIDKMALEENADVMYDRKDGSIAWRPDIRSPGVPANARRLGDLRLECRVDTMGAHVGRSVGLLGFLNVAGDDPCNNPRFVYHFYADKPIFNIVISEGSRRSTVLSDSLYGNDFDEWMIRFLDWPLMRDRVFVAPLRDTSWSDDALLQFEYFDDMSVATSLSPEPGVNSR